ncbi:MAG: hypothetical protein HGB19_05125, partial [Chlorobiales bacterium]|nr:hypothetical protein [Chlorobiales bacterium]
MKNKKMGKRVQSLLKLMIALTLVVQIAGCADQNSSQPNNNTFSGKTEDLVVPQEFNYETVKDVKVTLKLLGNDNAPLKNVSLQIYNDTQTLLATGLSDASGICEVTLTLPTYYEKLIVRPNYVGLSSDVDVPIQGKTATATIGGASAMTGSQKTIAASTLAVQTSASKVGDYYTLGTWDKNGVPEYMEPQRDVISQGLLDDINASLPETRPVPTYNPEYLDPNRPDMNTKLKEMADVYITFVHEGAGYKNVLGFYTYDLNNPPKSVSEIQSMFVIFPNVSYSGSGG